MVCGVEQRGRVGDRKECRRAVLNDEPGFPFSVFAQEFVHRIQFIRNVNCFIRMKWLRYLNPQTMTGKRKSRHAPLVGRVGPWK